MILKARETLKRFFGHDAFRGGQEGAVAALLSGRDALCVMPTGAGKSVCYQVPALLLPGITLVISPLIALMKDQVTALIASGVPAAYLNSSLTMRQMDLALSRARQGQYKLIYVAPERLLTPGFLSFAREQAISLVAVDEAHCVSQWGQDFRPSYLSIADFVQSLPKRPPVGAFTATATASVREDIRAFLRLQEPEDIITGYDRANLFFEVRRPKDKFEELMKIEADHRYESGIVYCQTRKAVEEVHKRLEFMGVWATRYHAGLSDEERHRNQDDFINDRRHVMVATNAFGMGIDKSNVSYVVHYNMPKDLESYYQEAGRAGRDGSAAQCVLLYSGQDVHTAQFLIDHAQRPEGVDEQLLPELLKRDHERLRQMVIYATTNECLRDFILRYFGEKSGGYCGHCGNCLTHYREEDMTEAAASVALCIHEMAGRGLRFGRGMVADILRGSRAEKILKFRLDTLSCYGSRPGDKPARLLMLMDEMLRRGILALEGDAYPCLALTPQADSLLSGEVRFTMKQPEEKKTPATLRAASGDLGDSLYQALKKLRGDLAKKSGLPAYIIFTDATLRDMAQKRPTTLDAFAMVSGVGRAKTEKYGLLFLNEIRTFMASH